MCFYALCRLSNHTALDKKSVISLVMISPGNAETNINGSVKKLNGHLMQAVSEIFVSKIIKI